MRHTTNTSYIKTVGVFLFPHTQHRWFFQLVTPEIRWHSKHHICFRWKVTQMKPLYNGRCARVSKFAGRSAVVCVVGGDFTDLFLWQLEHKARDSSSNAHPSSPLLSLWEPLGLKSQVCYHISQWFVMGCLTISTSFIRKSWDNRLDCLLKSSRHHEHAVCERWWWQWP